MWILPASLDVWASRTCAHNRQTEDRAVIAGPALVGGPVKVAVGGWHQRGGRQLAVSTTTFTTEAVDSRQGSAGGDSEDRATAINTVGAGTARVSSAVKVAVRGLHQPGERRPAVSAVVLRAKAVEPGQVAAGGDFEDGATPELRTIMDLVGSALAGGPVKVAVIGLKQLAVGELAVRSLQPAIPVRTKGVKRGQASAGGEFEDGATPKPATVIAAGPAVAGGPVKVTVSGLNQPIWTVAVGAVALRAKGVDRGQRPAGGDFEDRPTAVVGTVIGPAPASDPVKIAVGSQHQAAGVPAVSAVGLRAKAVERSQCAAGSDFEDRAGIIGSASARGGGPVKGAVRRLHQGAVRISTVSAGVGVLRTKAVERSLRPVGVILKTVPQPVGLQFSPPAPVVP